MRQVNANFISEKNKEANKPIFLYKIHSFNGVDNLFYAEYDINVTFDGQEYTAFPITHEFVEENTGGQITSVKLKISNISRLIQAYLELYDLRGKRVDIIAVWADKLDQPETKTVDTFYIDSYLSNESDAEFTITSKLDVIDLPLPSGKYLRTHCRWKFKGSDGSCGYSGAETECNRTFQRCKELGNYQRFGNFPSIPFRNIYVAG